MSKCNRVLSFLVRRCEVVDDKPFPLSQTVYNTFVFGGRSVVSEHIGYYTDRKGNDIVLETWWLFMDSVGCPALEPAHYYLFSDLT